MKANEFVKKFGLDTFRLSLGFVSTRKYLVVYEDEIDFTDEIKPSHGKCVFDRLEVKRLVESHELVKSYGGLGKAKTFTNSEYRRLSQPKTYNRLCEAITDVESCM